MHTFLNGLFLKLTLGNTIYLKIHPRFQNILIDHTAKQSADNGRRYIKQSSHVRHDIIKIILFK